MIKTQDKILVCIVWCLKVDSRSNSGQEREQVWSYSEYDIDLDGDYYLLL